MPVEHNFNIPVSGLRLAIDSKNLKSFPGQNFLLQTEDFSKTANWTVTNPSTVGSVVHNAIVGPFGYGAGDLLRTGNTSPSLISQSVSTTIVGTGSLICSVYAKAETSTSFTLNCYYNGDTEINATFNLSNGTISGGNGDPAIESVGNGWYRCYVTVPARVGSGTSFLWRIWPETRPSATSIGCYFWGPHLRNPQANNEYVATTTSAITTSGTINDISGYGNNLTMNAGVSTSRVNGCSFFMSGTSTGNLSRDTTNSLPGGDATILVWHRPASDTPADTYSGLVRWGVGANVDPSTAMALSLNTLTSTYFVSSAYWNNDYVPNNANVVAIAGQWNLIGMRCNAGLGPSSTDNTNLLKYNSAGFGSVTGRSSSGRRITQTNSTFRIGCLDPSGARPSKGEFGSVYVYNKYLTDVEISNFIAVTKGKYGVS